MILRLTMTRDKEKAARPHGRPRPHLLVNAEGRYAVSCVSHGDTAIAPVVFGERSVRKIVLR